MSKDPQLPSLERIEEKILEIRGERVIVDADLARFYGVTTRRLNEQVRRNRERFPDDFMFRMTKEEKEEVVANCDHLSNLRYSNKLPRAYTEHGAIMAANVLNAPLAIAMGVFVVRAFVNLRRRAATHRELAAKLAELERRLAGHDSQIATVVKAIRALAGSSRVPPKRRIGFDPERPDQ